MGWGDGGLGDCEQSKSKIIKEKNFKLEQFSGFLIQSSKGSKVCHPTIRVLHWRWRTGTNDENKKTCGGEQVSLFCRFILTRHLI